MPARRTTGYLEARVDPFLHVIEGVFHRIGILPRGCLAKLARANAVGRALDDEVFFVGAGRDLVVDFVVAQKIMAAHAEDQDRHGDLLQMTGRRVVVRAIIDIVERMFGADRPGAEERSDRQEFRAIVE